MSKTQTKHKKQSTKKGDFNFFDDEAEKRLKEEHAKGQAYAERILYGMKNIDDVIELEVELDDTNLDDTDLDEVWDEYEEEDDLFDEDEIEPSDDYEEDEFNDEWN